MTREPAGQPFGEAHAPALAPVWCIHKIKWDPNDDGYYVPVETDADHPDVPCRNVGSIPPHCQPVSAVDPHEYPNAGPHAVAEVLDELGEERVL